MSDEYRVVLNENPNQETYQAQCSCGWSSHEYRSKKIASRAVTDHIYDHEAGVVHSPEPDSLEDIPPSGKDSILREAYDLVHGPRNKDYGDPWVNHERTADLFSTYLGHPVSAYDVCMLNLLQKISRLAHKPARDGHVDIAGYAENAQLVMEHIQKEIDE